MKNPFGNSAAARSGHGARRWWQAALLLSSGAAIALTSAARLVPGLQQLAADPVSAGLLRGEAATTMRLDEARRMLADAIRGPVSADLALELADATIQQHAGDTPADLTAKSHMEAAQAALELALRHSPADAYLWTRLAHVRLWLDRPQDQVARAAVAAMEMAPYARNLVLRRIDLALRVWPALTRAQLETVYEQIRFAYIDLNLRNDIVAVTMATASIGFASQALQGRTIFDGTDAQEDYFRLLRR